MKTILLAALLTLALALLPAGAQEKPAQKFEHAIIKWDGPDKVQYILPDKFELVRLGETHPLPKNAQPEEFYLAMAANELAKQGWEAVGIDSRRILLRRPVAK